MMTWITRRTRRKVRKIRDTFFLTSVIVVVLGSFLWTIKGITSETPPSAFEEESLLTACIPPQEGKRGEYVRVVDGDTAIFRTEGEEYRVRYIGVNTPEKGQDYYQDATTYNKEILSSAKEIWLYKDVSEKDRYNRLLRHVVADGKFVNLLLVESGYAQAMTVPPDVACADEFLEAQETARQENRGLWGK